MRLPPWLMILSLFLALPHPARTQSPYARPEAATPATLKEEISTLQRESEAKCKSPLTFNRIFQNSTQPKGTLLHTSFSRPGAFQCGEAVTIILSYGPQPSYNPPPPTYAGPPPVAVPKGFPVGYLGVADDIATLQQRAMALCHTEPQISQKLAPASQQRGSYLGQDPPAATIYQCGMAITINKSIGPQPVQPFLIGNLSAPRDVEVLTQHATALCGTAPVINQRPENSAEPAGKYLGQAPPASTLYQCNMVLTEYVSNGQVSAPVPPPPPPGPTSPSGTPASPTNPVPEPSYGLPGSVIIAGLIILILIALGVAWLVFRTFPGSPPPVPSPKIGFRRAGPPAIVISTPELHREKSDIVIDLRITHPAESHIVSKPIRYTETLLETETQNV